MGRALSICASFLIASAPFQAAFAQDVDRDVGVAERRHEEYEPLGKRIGGFDLNASVELGATSSDNLFAQESGDERDDIFYDVRPDVRLSSHWSRHAIEIGAGGAFSRYDKYGSEDADTHYFDIKGRLDLSNRTVVNAGFNTATGVESRTDPDALLADEPVTYDVTTTSLSVSHDFSRITAYGGVTNTEFDYHDAGTGVNSEQDQRDRTETAYTGRLEYELSPRVFLLGQATRDHVDYDEAISQGENSDGTTLLAGIRLELSNLLRGQFSVGHFKRDYDVGNSVDGVALAGDIDWFATPLTTVNLHVSRDAQESSNVTPYVNTTVALHADHELLRNLIVSAGVAKRNYDYQGEGYDRTDDVLTYDVGARYRMNRRMELNAGYGHNDTSSSGADRYRDFEENRFRVGIKFSL